LKKNFFTSVSNKLVEKNEVSTIKIQKNNTMGWDVGTNLISWLTIFLLSIVFMPRIGVTNKQLQNIGWYQRKFPLIIDGYSGLVTGRRMQDNLLHPIFFSGVLCGINGIFVAAGLYYYLLFLQQAKYYNVVCALIFLYSLFAAWYPWLFSKTDIHFEHGYNAEKLVAETAPYVLQQQQQQPLPQPQPQQQVQNTHIGGLSQGPGGATRRVFGPYAQSVVKPSAGITPAGVVGDNASENTVSRHSYIEQKLKIWYNSGISNATLILWNAVMLALLIIVWILLWLDHQDMLQHTQSIDYVLIFFAVAIIINIVWLYFTCHLIRTKFITQGLPGGINTFSNVRLNLLRVETLVASTPSDTVFENMRPYAAAYGPAYAGAYAAKQYEQ
jgi:hypothetical protein